MSKELDNSLKKIAKGTLIIFLGLFIGELLNFLTRIIIVRNLTPSEYGIFSLVVVIVLLSTRLSSLGLQAGITRYLSFFRARKDHGKILGTVVSSIKISSISSIISFFILFFGAQLISIIFHNPELVYPLKVYSIALPFLLMTIIFISIYRGLERADVHFIFQEIIRNLSIILGMVVLLFIGFTLYNVVYIYLISAVLTCVTLAIYSYKRFFRFLKKHVPSPMGKQILFFSFPVLARIFSNQIITWSDVLMLGYFKESDVVGMYNVSLLLANYMIVFLTAATFLYFPLSTKLYSSNKHATFSRIYSVVTKWIFSATLPAALILFLFPSQVLGFLYGSDYISAGFALSILAMGFMVHIFLGPNTETLMVVGKTKFIMYAAMSSAIINIILNLLFIPNMGMIGAAIASAIALAYINLLISIKLYHLTGIHPFTKTYLKPCLLSILSIVLVYLFAINFLVIEAWMLPILFVFFVIIYVAALLLTKSFDKEDLMMLLLVEKRMGLNLSFIKNILNRFV